ncbi:cytochrome d ubiquinol oxidase subunit II [Aeromicrobium tamlense]|uniref:Cytochrome d ubiquinol oxidase subunit II n=1 Tax=Aeromicrobium tamlense TaxID=375541 RepID=A0A8I0KJJ8_9ACTN|nr:MULTISPECIES: cytochrome d ubiquinol oxidase subunit II [Aeromicrobium]MBD1270601.1 cytochrome d ubiquinol oxidase subunit II [Aeromicrobium tamlense]MBD1271267.1 cytochrome d ubiquinol oxidase subunit II [Aeromicrobium tamlense]NYI37988.1 cytochrome d ubiquinol oxidase subunit II [Aeromicrobium tamlense]
MELTTVWFILIAFLFVGYFVLEGFDFGVGMLVGLLAKDEKERRVLVNTIGPVWDGNEVWLIVGGGALFAAFPEWYATLFSGFYLPLFLILVALIIRGVAFEYRGLREHQAWRDRWDWAIIVGSFLPALLWGVAFANIARGVPLNESHEYVGGFFNLLNPYALLGGVMTTAVFLTHGAIFVALKTVGDIRVRAHAFAQRVGVVAALLAVAFIGWTAARDGDPAVWIIGAVAAVAFLGALAASHAERDGWAFVGTAVAIAGVVIMLFVSLFPDVMPSTLDPAFSLTTENASSTPYTLKIMTWVAVAFTPIVLIYQSWSYWVFRKRIGVQHIPA